MALCFTDFTEVYFPKFLHLNETLPSTSTVLDILLTAGVHVEPTHDLNFPCGFQQLSKTLPFPIRNMEALQS